MDNESYKWNNSYEEFSHYLYEHPSGDFEELKKRFGTRRVNGHCAIGFITETISGHYRLTKKGKEFLDLKYKPLTIWERIVDLWYFKVLRVKLNLN